MSWDEYQRLVLAELTRQDEAQKELGRDVRNHGLILDRLERAVKEEKEWRKETDETISLLDKSKTAKDAVSLQTKWLLGLSITILLSTAVPLLTLVFGGGT